MFEFKNKVALITGGAAGIGLAYAKELLRNGLKGVALVDINQQNGSKAAKEIADEFKRNDCVIFIKSDVSDSKQLENAFDVTVKTYNQLDILINNAGILDEVHWERCIDVNLKPIINGTQLAIEKYFPKYRSGSESVIINTASVAALVPIEANPVYGASKCGITGYTRAMGGSTRYTDSKTRVIAICPGLVYTDSINVTKDQVREPYLTDILNMIKSMPGQTPEEIVQKIISVIPDAPTGSVWLAAPGVCTKVDFPDYTMHLSG